MSIWGSFYYLYIVQIDKHTMFCGHSLNITIRIWDPASNAAYNFHHHRQCGTMMDEFSLIHQREAQHFQDYLSWICLYCFSAIKSAWWCFILGVIYLLNVWLLPSLDVIIVHSIFGSSKLTFRTRHALYTISIYDIHYFWIYYQQDLSHCNVCFYDVWCCNIHSLLPYIKAVIPY